MIEDDISKWEVTGLVYGSVGNAKYNTSKLLNTASNKMQCLIRDKSIDLTSRFLQVSLPIVSMVGKAIGGHSKLEFHEHTQFEDNQDIVICPRIHPLETPVLSNTDEIGFLAMEEDHIYEVAQEIIHIFENLLDDDTVTTLYVYDILLPNIQDRQCVKYATSYAVYRKGT